MSIKIWFREKNCQFIRNQVEKQIQCDLYITGTITIVHFNLINYWIDWKKDKMLKLLCEKGILSRTLVIWKMQMQIHNIIIVFKLTVTQVEISIGDSFVKAYFRIEKKTFKTCCFNSEIRLDEISSCIWYFVHLSPARIEF